MAIDKRYHYKHKNTLRDVRTVWEKLRDTFMDPTTQVVVFGMAAGSIAFAPYVYYVADLIFLFMVFYFFWLKGKGHKLPAKLPLSASLEKIKDPNNNGPGRNERAEGIMFVGNVKDSKEEIWFTSSDIKTHILYLGTTGAGKTVGLTSLVTNAMTWGSGYVYVDGKADTGLWSSLSALARRFGRDDDLLVLNYMTANSDSGGTSNTLNPFAGGSASYLVQLLVSLMPDAGGDNAMWKERAVSLISSIMPALTWKRQHQEIPLNINSIRECLNLPKIIQLSRDPDLPRKIVHGIKGYLDTLPGYSDEYFDDDGNEKPMPPDGPMVDTATIYQQHGYLSMQFTRSLQSLADDYGYVFETENADIDMTDVVLNRRILVVLIPALEKSSDEAANLGKIVAANIKGMMGSTLGADVEGDAQSTIENKPSESKTPFITVFDEVGYYASQGMAVMAAQARSLGFCLVYAAQDLAAMEKRVKEEARSITANCNLKIFGKLEDPQQTKEFFEKTVGDVLVAEVSGFETQTGSLSNSYRGKADASMQSRARASYDDLRSFKEGQAVVTFGEMLEQVQVFYANPGNAKSMRVQRMLEPPKADEKRLRQKHTIINFLDNYRSKGWSMKSAAKDVDTAKEIALLAEGFKVGRQANIDLLECGALSLAKVGETFLENYEDEIEKYKQSQENPNSATTQANEGDVSASSSASQTTNTEDDDDDISWSSLMSGMDDDDDDDDNFDPFADSGLSEETPETVAQSTQESSAPAASVTTNEDDDDGGFSFSDIMGGDDDNEDDVTPAAPMPQAEVMQPEPVSQENVESPTLETPSQPATGAGSVDHVDDGQDNDDDGFSFSDIMGGDDGDDNDDPVPAAPMPQAEVMQPEPISQEPASPEQPQVMPEQNALADNNEQGSQSDPKTVSKEPLSWSDLAEDVQQPNDQSTDLENTSMPGVTADDLDDLASDLPQTTDDDDGFSFSDVMGDDEGNEVTDTSPVPQAEPLQSDQVSAGMEQSHDATQHYGTAVEHGDNQSSQNQETPQHQQADGDFDTIQAVQNAKKSGRVELPSGLSEDVHSLLETTAKTVTSGLFSSDNSVDDFEEADKDEGENEQLKRS